MVEQPSDDLLGRAVLGRVIGRGDVRVQRRSQGPRLRAVDHHLDKPHRPVVGSQPAPRLTALGVATGDPRLVVVPGQRSQRLDSTGTSGVAAGDTDALGQVVVIRPAAIGLDIVARSGRHPGVDLHPAAHLPTPLNNDQHNSPETRKGPAKRGPSYLYW